MKQVCKGGILMSAIVFGCLHLPAQGNNNQQVNHSQKKEVNMTITQSTEKNKEIVRKLYEDCLNTGKFELLNQLVAEDYTGPGGEKGPQGMEGVVKTLRQGFPDIKWAVEDLVAEGDRVVIRWQWKGTHTGTFRGFAPTQKKITNDGIAIYQLNDGKIMYVWMQTDRLGFFQQIGVVPQIPVPQPQN